MSSGVESINIVQPWLYQRLSGDAALTAIVGDRISDTLAPGTLVTPYCTFALASNRDRMTSSGARIWTTLIYDVKIVAQTASWTGAIGAAARRLDELLVGEDGRGLDVDVPGGHLEIRRERTIQEAELQQAMQMRHLGARYRVLAYSL